MDKLHSIKYRITSLTFLLVLITVLVLIYLANWQMTHHFYTYLSTQPSDDSMMHMNRLGASEMYFLNSMHASLLWVGLVILLVGLIASYILARNITIPLSNLSAAVKKIGQGQLGQTVAVERTDEVGQLAKTFNQMSKILAENEHMRQELLANVAHELRTPLAILQGNLESMLDGVIQPDQKRLFSMQEEVMRLTRLVTDLRDLSLAEVHQLNLQKKSTDINLLLHDVANMIQPLAEEKQLRIQYDLAENLPKAMVDSDRICQVFYNIIGNALRYTKTGNIICLKSNLITINGSQKIKLQISDNGPGISPADLPYIFHHFYRGEKSRNRESGGSGIGLALAKQFIENHNGTINVISTLDEGTTFTIFLPIF